jgi:hypothetical protein
MNWLLFFSGDAFEEIAIITQLQESVHNSRGRIRSLEREVKQKNLDGEAVRVI